MSAPGRGLAVLQPLGRALMLPIAVLPVAGLLLRLGQPDMLAIPFVAAAGNAVFHNLGLIFAAGVAVGLARGGDGAAALAGVVCFLVAGNGAEALISAPPQALAGFAGKAVELARADFRAQALYRLSVPLGILSGVIAGALFNRFSTVKLPDYLAFFGGRRFVPIISGLAGIGLALVFGLSWSNLSAGMDGLSRAIVAAGPFGLFLYGVLNRLLIVTGLHHILNNLAWFIIGDFHGATGDLNRFFAGDPSAGAFMAGFFPVMMFGLPAACLAMYHTARPERRAAVGGLLLSLALTSLLTGVTEPIEFSFMFLAPALYAVHAVLTGVSMVVMNALGVRLGFSFSAGLFDYLINFGRASRPLLLLPVGAVYFGVYYGVFRFAIARFGLPTPGREPEAAAPTSPAPAGQRAERLIAALGGAKNLRSVEACATRLRLVVADQGAVDPAALKALGAMGVIRPSPRDLQVVLGPIADDAAREMRALLSAPASPAAVEGKGGIDHPSPGAVLEALGGAANLADCAGAGNRVLVGVRDGARIDEGALFALGVRALARPAPGRVQLILAGAAGDLADDLAALA
ncbi:MAG TPA: N-acetylglucosamine-specific PTS transporter subunit IIBC [Caulobacteraceae bacterium]|nr:N-acetylglucosamine-specific PTS transporter subunit IIBC [Caulobacteraceae bacterium]